VAIIFIVVSVLLATTTGFFMWQFTNQANRVDSLRVEKTNLELEIAELKRQAVESVQPVEVVEASEISINTTERSEKDQISQMLRDVGADDDFDLGKVVNSSKSPYQYMQTSSAGGILTIYRVSPDNNWVYAYGGQVAPDCRHFEHPLGERYALWEVACLDDANDVTTVGQYFSR
jgi:hypothetical protein